MNIRKIRSPASIKSLKPSSGSKRKETELDDKIEKAKDLNKTEENFKSVRSSTK